MLYLFTMLILAMILVWTVWKLFRFKPPDDDHGGWGKPWSDGRPKKPFPRGGGGRVPDYVPDEWVEEYEDWKRVKIGVIATKSKSEVDPEVYREQGLPSRFASTGRRVVTRTAVEIDDDGTPVRVFHRKGREVWTHLPGQPLQDPSCPETNRSRLCVLKDSDERREPSTQSV